MIIKDENISLPKDSAAITLDGECLEEILRDLRETTSEKSATQVLNKAVETVRNCVTDYVTAIGKNDVGAIGNGHVALIPKSHPNLNGLIYGRVQSGKTNASLVTVALAKANGFRIFVVLTSDNTWLGSQTAARFREQLSKGDGLVVRSWEDWRSDPKGFAKDVAHNLDDGLVLITTKNTKNITGLLKVLSYLKANNRPALILDDEADNASLNTKLASMARGKTNEPSKIYELIGEIRNQIPAHIFIQITATPQSLLLQSLDGKSRPHWSVLLEPGEDYVGGDVFFERDSSYTIEVDDDLTPLRRGRIRPGNDALPPLGLAKAISCFVTGAAILEVTARRKSVLSMLVHIAHTKVSHESVKTVIKNYLGWLDRSIRGKSSVTNKQRAIRLIEDAYAELSKTYKSPPGFAQVLAAVANSLRSTNPQIIDADNPNQQPSYVSGMNFLIGGNRLGRGVTINGLSVTYYGRDAKSKTTDTVHQHARMFGYRRNLLPITRLFCPPNVLAALKDIHESDKGTREALENGGIANYKPIWLGNALQPTRAGVYDPSDVRWFRPGSAIYPQQIIYSKTKIADDYRKLEKLLSEFDDPDEYYEVPISFLIKVVSLMKSDHVAGAQWEDKRVANLLENLMHEPINQRTGRLNVRRGIRGEGLRITRKDEQRSGFAAGQQINAVRKDYPNQPTLLIRKQAGRKEDDGWDDHPFYSPTLVLPSSRFALLYVSR